MGRIYEYEKEADRLAGADASWRTRPPGTGVATIARQEKLITQEKPAEVPSATNGISLAAPARLTLTVLGPRQGVPRRQLPVGELKSL